MCQDYSWGTIVSINGVGKTEYSYTKNEVGPFFTSYTKINSNWIKDVKVRAKTIGTRKHEKLHDTRFDSDFLDMLSKA